MICTDSEGKGGIGWREREEEERGGGKRDGVSTRESAREVGGLSRDWSFRYSDSDWREERLKKNGDKSSHG